MTAGSSARSSDAAVRRHAAVLHHEHRRSRQGRPPGPPAFQAGLAALDRDLGKPVHRELIQAPTGPEALLVYDRPAPG